MKKLSNVLWGLVIVAIGVILGLKSFGMNIDIFFDGWWTLFIIVPCTVSLFTDRDKTGNLIGIAIGVFLLLCCQDILSFALLWKLLVPAIIVIIGLKLIFGGLFGNRAHEMINTMKLNGNAPRVGCATFSGCNMIFDGEPFEGAELTAVFGGVKCDLRGAVIDKDCAITVSAVFGGIDILVPPNVNVKTNVNGIFGGVSNKARNNKDNAVTIYVSGLCIFGGADIK